MVQPFLENTLAVSSVRHIPRMWPSHSTPKYFPKKNKKICHQVFIDTLFVTEKKNKCQTWMNKHYVGMDERIIVYPHNRIKVSNKSNWIIDKYHNIAESDWGPAT